MPRSGRRRDHNRNPLSPQERKEYLAQLRRQRALSASNPDVRFENHGTVVLVRLLTSGVRAWVEENVHTEGWQWLGDAFSCEPRCAGDLAAVLNENGFTVGGVR